MSVQKLITEHLDLWTGAIARKSSSGRGSRSKVDFIGVKKLRELILTLGFEGLLTGHNPSSWKNTTLGNIGQWGSGGTPTKSRREFYNGDIPWLVIGDLNDSLVTSAESSITEDGLKNSSARIVPPNTLLIAMYGSIGKLGITGISCATNQAIAFCIHDKSQVELRFLFLFLLRARANLLNMGQGLAQQNISQKLLKSVAIKLPALDEQRCIVQKVDELMTLCDRLEQQTSDQLEAHETLVETLLGTLTQSENATDLADNWARLATHFDTLFTTEQSIEKLKQTILQLAVMGRLVEQHESDGSALELLRQIEERKTGTKERKAGNGRDASSNSQSHAPPFDIPQNWTWAPLRDVGFTSTGKTPSTKESRFFSGGIPFLGPGQITNSGDITASDKFLSEEGLAHSDEALPDDILTVCIGGSIGKTAKIKIRCGFNQQLNKIRPVLVSSDYLLTALTADFFKAAVLAKATGSATPIINRSKWESIEIPLAPLSEQVRIVAKVNALMALCDQLKEHLNQASETRCQLADAIVEGALH